MNRLYNLEGIEDEIYPSRLNFKDITRFFDDYSEAVKEGRSSYLLKIVKSNTKWKSYGKPAQRLKIFTTLFFLIFILLILLSFLRGE